jgi:hypothetical protein
MLGEGAAGLFPSPQLEVESGRGIPPLCLARGAPCTTIGHPSCWRRPRQTRRWWQLEPQHGAFGGVGGVEMGRPTHHA